MNNIPDKNLSMAQLKQIGKFFTEKYNECKTEVIHKNLLYNSTNPCTFLLNEHMKYCKAYKEKKREATGVYDK
jgi:hypothetical protein